MRVFVIGAALLTSVMCFGQTPRPLALGTVDDFASTKPSTAPTSLHGADYRIGSDDLLDIDVFEVMELAATPRVSASGTISLKFLGGFQAGGLTPQELERKIESALKEKNLVNEPQVTVTVREYASQPVSIMGAVRMPNIYQIKGEKTLFSMIAQAQGLDPDAAGSTVQIFREGQVINIDIAEVRRGNLDLDIPIYANDKIYVPTAGSVFVMGEVLQPGEFFLKNGTNLSVLKAIAKSGGPTRTAKKSESRIIRIHTDGTREEILVDVDKVARGKADDIELMANDILVLPANKAKIALTKSIESTIGVVTGRLIYGF